MIEEPLSETLQKLRVATGLTPSDLARKCGVNLLTINLYENPYYEQYDLKTVKRLVEACGGKLSIDITSSAEK